MPSVDPALLSESIDFSTIVLRFSMMFVVANLRVGGFFELVGSLRLGQRVA